MPTALHAIVQWCESIGLRLPARVPPHSSRPAFPPAATPLCPLHPGDRHSAGVRVDFVRTLGWALSGASGAVAGLLLTSNGNGSFSPESLEFSLLLISGFIAAVIGGLDSLVGAVIGGIFLGLVTSFVLMYVSGSLFFIAPFVILLLVLFIRPQGIVGVKAGRRA